MTKTEIEVILALLTKGHYLVTNARSREMAVAKTLAGLGAVHLAPARGFPGCFQVLPKKLHQE